MLEPSDPTSQHPPTVHDALDLDAVERDLTGVERALDRLESGTYWQCEATGADLPDDLLAADPLATRLPAPETI